MVLTIPLLTASTEPGINGPSKGFLLHPVDYLKPVGYSIIMTTQLCRLLHHVDELRVVTQCM